jgi:hypothetical protein
MRFNKIFVGILHGNPLQGHVLMMPSIKIMLKKVIDYVINFHEGSLLLICQKYEKNRTQCVKKLQFDTLNFSYSKCLIVK